MSKVKEISEYSLETYKKLPHRSNENLTFELNVSMGLLTYSQYINNVLGKRRTCCSFRRGALPL